MDYGPIRIQPRLAACSSRPLHGIGASWAGGVAFRLVHSMKDRHQVDQMGEKVGGSLSVSYPNQSCGGIQCLTPPSLRNWITSNAEKRCFADPTLHLTVLDSKRFSHKDFFAICHFSRCTIVSTVVCTVISGGWPPILKKDGLKRLQ